MATTTGITARSQEASGLLLQLETKLGDASPVLTAIGEDMSERIKQRFATANAHDGSSWRPNTQVTIMNYLKARSGFSAKTGKISAKGQKLAIFKRPLQGLNNDLARQIVPVVKNNVLSVVNTMAYAAMQHYGGQKSQFPKLWGDIPSRRFMPLTLQGEMDEGEKDLVLDRLREYLQE